MAEGKEKTFNITTIVLVVLLLVTAFLLGSTWTKLQKEQTASKTQQVAASPTVAQQPAREQLPSTVGGFLLTGDEVCKENGKPVFYFFGASFCPHCQWEHPIIQEVVPAFGNEIVFHDNMDKQTADEDIYDKYSSINNGGVPFLLLGCSYARPGSGENVGKEEEKKNLTAVLCKLTNGNPKKVCDPVKDLTAQIK